MKIKKKLAFLLFFSSTAIFSQTLQQAIKETDNELYSTAEKNIKFLIKIEPSNGLNYFYLGENFKVQNELDSANYYWGKAAEKDPESPIALVANGKCLLFKNDLLGANELFNKSLTKTKRKNTEIIRAIVTAYIEKETQNFDESFLLLNRAIELEPKNEMNYILLGDLSKVKTPDNVKDALKNYNLGFDVNPLSARSLVRIGKLYQRLKTSLTDSLANDYYTRAKKIDPSYAPAYRENAELFLNANKPKKAIENWKIYLELNNSVEARYRYTTALFSSKQYCEAIEELKSLQNKGFSNLYVERMLIYAYAECTSDKENASKGLLICDKFFNTTPKDKITYVDFKYRAQLLYNSGNDSLSLIEYEKVCLMDLRAKNELSGIIAKIYSKNKNYIKAIENYEYKQSQTQLTAVELFDLGRAYYFGPKSYTLADTTFSKLSLISPSYAAGYFWRARTKLQLDVKNEKWLARPFYEKTFDLIKPEEITAGNNKQMRLESALYLGDYYYSSSFKDLAKAKSIWTFVLELDPSNAAAKTFFSKVK